MDREAMLERVARLGGLESSERAERTLVAVTRAVRPAIDDEDARALAEFLPEPLAGLLRAPAGREGPEGIYARVASLEEVKLGFAVEHTQAVCRALGEALPEAERSTLKRALPPELAALLEPEQEFAQSPRSPSFRAAGTTLADGRPGSRHPLSEAKPERAHAHSVARSDNPHAGTKLSSAEGLRQERSGDTLATGRPGSRRPIARSS